MTKIDNKIKERCELAAKEGKLHFKTQNKLAEFLGIDVGTLTKERQATIRKYGITWETQLSAPDKKELIDKQIKERCELAVKEGNLHFETQNKLLDFLSIGTNALTKERQTTIKEYGITWETQLSAPDKKELIDKQIKERCELAVKEGNLHFETQNKLAEFLGIDVGTLTKERQATIKEYGITWETQLSAPDKKELIDKQIKECCELATKEGKLHFKTQQKLLDFLSIGTNALTKERQATIKEYGITWETQLSGPDKKELIDKQIKERCELAAKEGKLHFKTQQKLAEFLGIHTSMLTKERQATIKEYGITWETQLSAPDKKELIDKQIKECCELATKEGNLHFKTQQKLAEFLGIHTSMLTKERQATIKEYGITWETQLSGPDKKELIDKQIKERCELAIKEGNLHFEMQNKLAEFFGISIIALTKERQTTIKEYGITWETQLSAPDKKELIDKQIKERCELAIKEGNLHFEARNKLAEFLGIDVGTLTKERRATIKEYGITWETQLFYAKKKENIDKQIKERCELAIKEGKLHFEMQNKLAEFLGIDVGTLTKERQATIKEYGITWETQLFYAKKKENIDKQIKERCELAVKDGNLHFEAQSKLAEFFGISIIALTKERQTTIKEYGITWETQLSAPGKKELMDKQIKERCELAAKEDKLHFETQQKLAEFLGIDARILTKERQAIIKEYGITWETQLSYAKKKELIDKQIKERCELAVKEGNLHFEARNKLAEFLGVDANALTEERQATIKEYGIAFGYGEKLSQNIQLAIQESETRGIQLESINALVEFSSDLLSREINNHKIQEAQRNAIYATTKQIMEHDTRHFKGIIEEAASKLILEGKEDFWIMELKFQLFLDGYYFTEDTILKTLALLNHNISFTQDSIDKRIRLAMTAKKEVFPNVIYSKELPAINTSEDASIYIDSSIQKNEKFIELWKEFALLIIKNNLLGHVSKTPIPQDWDETIESLISVNESYARAFFLDNEHIDQLKQMSYEGIASLAFLASRGTKDSLPKMFLSLAIRARGFFIFLNSKGLALFHAKYVTLTGAELSKKMLELLTEKHPSIGLFNKVAQQKAINSSPNIAKKFNQKNAHLHACNLALASNPKADLLRLSHSEINSYAESTVGYAKSSGTMAHNEFIYDLLFSNGNENAIRPKLDQSIVEYYNEQIQQNIYKISNNTLNYYKSMIKQMVDIVVFRVEEEKISKSSGKNSIRYIIFLLEFLSEFDHKLSRTELSSAFTPYIKTETLQMFEWAKVAGNEKKYRSATSLYKLLFDRIDLKEYQGVFLNSMILSGISAQRKTVRKGMELVVYNTIQEVARHKPPMANPYTLKRTASDENRSILDLSWWKFADIGLSPILPVFEWIMTKLPRRKKHLRWADANQFIQYDQARNIIGVQFSSDKNFNDPNLFIHIVVLRLLFTTEELAFIEDYIAYIKAAYSHIQPIKYDGGNFGSIQPLFPHHQSNDVISDDIVNTYHKRTMMITQIEVNQLAKDGIFNENYTEEQRERMMEYLSKIKLIKPMERYEDTIKIPTTFEEVNNLPSSKVKWFTDDQGIHNLRHAGATALAYKGLDLTQIKMVTGHKSSSVLLDVYLHTASTSLRKIVKDYSTMLNDLSGTPYQNAERFTNKITGLLINSEKPIDIEKTLKENGFFSLERVIVNMDTEIFGNKLYKPNEAITKGLQIASGFHPATWKSNNHGICPIAGRCPDGTNGCCALCPLYICHLMFAEGIINRLRETLIDLNIYSNKIEEAKRKCLTGSLEETRVAHQQKTSEMFGWLDVVEKLEAQLNTATEDEKDKSLPVAQVNKKLFSYRTVTVDEAMMEAIIQSRELKESTVNQDNYIAKLSSKIYRLAAKNYDTETLARMEKDELDWLIEECRNCDFEQKRTLLSRYAQETPINNDSNTIKNTNNNLLA